MAATAPPCAMFRESLQLLGRAARSASLSTRELETRLIKMAARVAPALQSAPHAGIDLARSKTGKESLQFSQHLSSASSRQGILLQNAGFTQLRNGVRWSQSFGRDHSGTATCPSCRSSHSLESASQNVGISHRAFHSSPLQSARHKAASGSQQQPLDYNRLAKRLSRRGQVACDAVVGSASALDVNIQATVLVEETIDIDDELDDIMGDLENSTPVLIKEALSNIDATEFEGIENLWLSVLLCTDKHIQSSNKKWRGEDKATDVLSFPQEWIEGVPEVLLGDVLISLDTARRQAAERGHSLLDELRILLVHGLLHLLDYDHEESAEEEVAMAGEEQRILSAMGWAGKGLIEAMSAEPATPEPRDRPAETSAPSAAVPSATGLRPGKAREYSEIKVLFLDMDGTLLNSATRLSKKTADACRAALARGVRLCIATGKARPAAIDACSVQGLSGPGGVVSTSSPGVFLQGLRVYGEEGIIVHSQELDQAIIREAYAFSLENRLALAGFSGDRCVTLFEHPLIDKLHTTYYEPKAEILPSIDALLASGPINKLLFYDTPATIHPMRSLWEKRVSGKAAITQAVPEMLEILPFGASKGDGVRRLMAHLEVSRDQVMAVGDGENDLEMLQIAGLGVAMANGAPVTLEAADAHVGSNDQDGVAEAIERFILSQ